MREDYEDRAAKMRRKQESREEVRSREGEHDSSVNDVEASERDVVYRAVATAVTAVDEWQDERELGDSGEEGPGGAGSGSSGIRANASIVELRPIPHEVRASPVVHSVQGTLLEATAIPVPSQAIATAVPVPVHAVATPVPAPVQAVATPVPVPTQAATSGAGGGVQGASTASAPKRFYGAAGAAFADLRSFQTLKPNP